jgi:hypothetical protein
MMKARRRRCGCDAAACSLNYFAVDMEIDIVHQRIGLPVLSARFLDLHQTGIGAVDS